RGHDVVRIVWSDDGTGLDERVRAAHVDVVFVALHGRGGEDGCVQGMLELMGIPYTGSGVLASALAMDKLKAKEMFRLHNVPTPPYYAAASAAPKELEELHGSFGFPAIVKPRREGSSVGLGKVESMTELTVAIERALAFDDQVLVELRAALEQALRFDADVLVERYVRGMEVTVGILDGRVLGAIEVAPKTGLYDYRSKYTPGLTEYVAPPRLPSTRLLGIMNLAERAARALACAGACRVDLLVTEGENEYVLEVNTLPGMTPTSLLPKIAAAAGLDYGTLCETILEGARLHSGLPEGAVRGTSAPHRSPHRSQVVVSGEEPAYLGAGAGEEPANSDAHEGPASSGTREDAAARRAAG
ncbi:MAG TPA: hypothetical protein VK841_13105, partial [Polyangiaceae bacterium]|nr:hypothetical protein [Polyangiaceae bacterium]